MFQIQDVLIPARFICFILQVLLTISIGYGYKDFIDVVNEVNDESYNLKYLFTFFAFFLALEIAEFCILISGYTLFMNLLSFLQIFFHSVTVLILNWFYRDVWEIYKIYIPFILGGIIPFLLELYNLLVLCGSNRRITKIK